MGHFDAVDGASPSIAFSMAESLGGVLVERDICVPLGNICLAYSRPNTPQAVGCAVRYHRQARSWLDSMQANGANMEQNLAPCLSVPQGGSLPL